VRTEINASGSKWVALLLSKFGGGEPSMAVESALNSRFDQSARFGAGNTQLAAKLPL
jgi:hypothetical protein